MANANRLLTTLVCGGLITGCASSTTIRSDPSGATVEVDGELIGRTPVEYRQGTVWLWTSNQVRLERPGYRPRTGHINATVSPPHLIFGLLCFWPLILGAKYRPEYHFYLERETLSDAAMAWDERAAISFSEGGP